MLEPERDDRVFQYFDSVFRDDDFNTYQPILQKTLEKKLAQAQAELAAATSQTKKKKAEKRIAALSKAGATETSLKDYYVEWRTFQMSDHLPLWVELKSDFSDSYLDYLSTYQAG
jgi:hypothetical protein